MHRSSWRYYGVKLIYQFVVTGSPIPTRVDSNYSDTHTFFEESILLVRAQSFDHAYKLAEQKAHATEESYKNPYGQAVTRKLVESIDCYLIDEELSHGTELYSSITPTARGTTPSDYLKWKYEYCLESKEQNAEHEKRRIHLQAVLRFEEFSRWREARQNEGDSQ